MRRENTRITSAVLSLMLTICMIAGLFMPVFADDETVTDQTAAAATEAAAEESRETEQAAETTETTEAATATENDTETASETETAAETDTETASETETATEEVAAPAHETALRAVLGDYDIKFKKEVITDEFLPSTCSTNTLKTTGKWKSIKLTWSQVEDTSAIDGYIIARITSGQSYWREIAKVGRTTTSYTDKTAKTKNKVYKYTLVPYVSTEDGIMTAAPSKWASALTTRSKKKNVYKFSINKPAKTTAVAAGKTVKLSLKFAGKAYSKSIRWTSSNKKIAKVTNSGKITGVSPGKVTLRGRTHTGRVIKTTVVVVEPGTAQGMVDVMKSWMGFSYANGKHKGIVDIYNSVKPWPVGYKMKYYDAWCACAVTSASIVSGNTDATGRECSVDRFVKIFKQKKIWIGDKTFVPQKGDLIVYNWLVDIKPKNASHIGVVESVSGDQVKVIEGNKGTGKVARRTVTIGWKYIKGYARPAYSGDIEEDTEDTEV